MRALTIRIRVRIRDERQAGLSPHQSAEPSESAVPSRSGEPTPSEAPARRDGDERRGLAVAPVEGGADLTGNRQHAAMPCRAVPCHAMPCPGWRQSFRRCAARPSPRGRARIRSHCSVCAACVRASRVRACSVRAASARPLASACAHAVAATAPSHAALVLIDPHGRSSAAAALYRSAVFAASHPLCHDPFVL